MNDIIDPEKNREKSEESTRVNQRSVYVRDDDQDWGSSGMNNIQKDSE